MTVSRPTSSMVTPPARGERVRGMGQQDELVGAERNRPERLVGRLKGEDAEIEAAAEQFGARSAGRARAARRTVACGCARANAAISGSTECTAASLAPMTTRPRRTCCSSRTAVAGIGGHPQEPRRVLQEQDSRPPSGCRCATPGRRADRPISSSSRRMAWLTAGWVRWSFLAAREKLRSAATAKTRDLERRGGLCSCSQAAQ